MLSPEILLKDEYEMQYYGFSTTHFMGEFRDMVKQIIQNTLTDMEQELTNNGCEKDELKKGIDILYLLYMESVNSMLKKFEAEFRNIFAIPDNVLLEEDKFKSVPISADEFKNLNKELSDLEQQLIQEKVFLATCQYLKRVFETKIDPVHKKVSNLLKMENKMFPSTQKQNEKSKNMLLQFKQKALHFTEATEESHDCKTNMLTKNEDFFNQ